MEEEREFFEEGGGDLVHPDVELLTLNNLPRNIRRRSRLTQFYGNVFEERRRDLKKTKSSSEICQGDDACFLKRRTSAM